MKMYPALAVKDSTFNKMFLDLYAQELRNNSVLLTQADWPLTLAHRTQQMLTAEVAPAPVPRQDSAVADDKPAVTPPASANPLSRGAYNQTRSPFYGYPWIRNY